MGNEGGDEEGEGMIDVDEMLAQLAQHEITFYACTIAHLVGVFTYIGNIADAGASWEANCRSWAVRDTEPMEVILPTANRDSDPRDLSKYNVE